MPGAMILINAIHTALQYGTLWPPPSWHQWVVGFGVVAIVSVCFHVLSYGRATVVALLVVLTSTIVLRSDH